MKRRKSQSVIKRNQVLLAQIKEIKTAHPLWGYRRIWSYLKYRQGIPVNKKRVYRLLREQGLLVTPQVRRKAKRGPIRPKPHVDCPDHFWGIDMARSACTPGDIVWPYDWDNPFEFKIRLAKWINESTPRAKARGWSVCYYNTDYPHRALGNLTPRQCYERYAEKERINQEPVLT